MNVFVDSKSRCISGEGEHHEHDVRNSASLQRPVRQPVSQGVSHTFFTLPGQVRPGNSALVFLEPPRTNGRWASQCHLQTTTVRMFETFLLQTQSTIMWMTRRGVLFDAGVCGNRGSETDVRVRVRSEAHESRLSQGKSQEHVAVRAARRAHQHIPRQQLHCQGAYGAIGSSAGVLCVAAFGG